MTTERIDTRPFEANDEDGCKVFCTKDYRDGQRGSSRKLAGHKWATLVIEGGAGSKFSTKHAQVLDVGGRAKFNGSDAHITSVHWDDGMFTLCVNRGAAFQATSGKPWKIEIDVLTRDGVPVHPLDAVEAAQ